MVKLFKLRTTPYDLGHLESKVMGVLWALAEANLRDASVREVIDRLQQPLAYTTVMTTLDRLFKKGLLSRRKEERAFFYTPRFSQAEWEAKRAGDLLSNMLGREKASQNVLISCLVDAVGSQDAALLDELEEKIRRKRAELERKGAL